MKAQTRIEAAVKACYDVYAEYSHVAEHMRVTAVHPRVTWERGSLKNPNTGWVIDGVLYPGAADDVIDLWNKQRAKWERRLWKARGITPEQLPLPDEPDVSA